MRRLVGRPECAGRVRRWLCCGFMLVGGRDKDALLARLRFIRE